MAAIIIAGFWLGYDCLDDLAKMGYDPVALSLFGVADSAFCSEEFIRMCLLRRLKGTITSHDKFRWTSEMTQISNWQPWVFTEDELEKRILN